MATAPFADKYKKNTYASPSDNVDYRVKRGEDLTVETEKIQKQWFLDKARWVYSSYLRDDTYIPYSQALDFTTNRLYAQGRQPIKKYRNILTVKDANDTMRKGWMNISWDVLPILPKFRAIILGKMEDIDYNIQVRAIDDKSNDVRDDAKLTVMLESKYGEMLKELRVAIGKGAEPEINDAQMPYIPTSMQELEMMSQLGAMKLAWEISMEKLLVNTGMRVDWPEIKRRLMEDAVDLGIIAVKDYQDPQTKQPMIRYVDPQNLIIRQTRRNDYYDVTEAGEICWYTLEQLKTYGLKDDELRTIGNSYQNLWGNTSMVSTFANQPMPQSVIGGIRAAVLDLEFQSFDRQFFEGRMIDNKMVTFELKHDSSGPTNKKNKFWTKEKPKYYRCKWVIGTDIIFDYGLQFDVPYKQKVEAKSSYSVYRISDRSMINQCIAVVDDMQMAIYKARNAVATSRPAGNLIEISSISEIESGGQKMKWNDILEIYNQTGNLIYRMPLNPANGMPIQGGVPPIINQPGGVGTYLDELIKNVDYNIKLIRDITGLNEIVDSSAPAPNALVGTAKIAEAASNYVLKPILYSYKSVKQRCFSNITNRWQIAGKFYPQEVSVNINNTAFEVIKVSADMYEPIFDTYCEALISDEDIARIEEKAGLSLQAAKTGNVGITLKDYFYIRQQIATGNIRWAWVYLGYREEQQEKMKNEAAAASNAQIAEQAMMLEDKKHTQAKELLIIEEQQKRLTLKLEYEFELKKLAMQNKSKPKEKPAKAEKK